MSLHNRELSFKVYVTNEVAVNEVNDDRRVYWEVLQCLTTRDLGKPTEDEKSSLKKFLDRLNPKSVSDDKRRKKKLAKSQEDKIRLAINRFCREIDNI